MDKKILKSSDMVSTGSAVLKALQNEEMISLDLLTREVLQNSLDAKTNKSFVTEEINIGTFDANKLADEFDGIEEELKKRSKLNKFISFKDKNTTGLTGPIKNSDVKDISCGKFLSLVKNIAKAQREEGAGGSWGYGKTVYYRIGIGLVIFYTRILEDGEYKSRLMACFIANENTDSNFLPEKTKQKTGIAWWGIEDTDEILPVEDEYEIERILKYFKLTPYENDETGTTIIIPYIDEEELLKETCKTEERNKKPWWCSSLEDYITVAVQRWYPVRIMNDEYKNNPWLKVVINGKVFDKYEMLPLFEIMQNMYNFNNNPEDYSKEKLGYEIIKEPINLQSIFELNSVAGNLMMVRLTKEQLRMEGNGNNEESPYTQIDNQVIGLDNTSTNSTNHHIVAFCRKPGMILKYDTQDTWVHGLKDLDENTFVIALFVPNSENGFREPKGLVLEEYLRASEKADHENWTDIQKITFNNQTYKIGKKVVESIIRNVREKIKKKDEDNTVKPVLTIGTKLNRELASRFMPKKGFGKKPKKDPTPVNPGKTPTPKSSKRTSLVLGNLTFENDCLCKRFTIFVGKNDKEALWEFKIGTDGSTLSADEWEKEENIGSAFPVEFDSLLIESITHNESGNIDELNDYIDVNSTNDYYNVAKLNSKKHKVWYGFKLNVNDEDIKEIHGKMFYKTTDSKIITTIERG